MEAGVTSLLRSFWPAEQACNAHLRLVLEQPYDAASSERPVRGVRQRLVWLPVLGLARRQLLEVHRLPLVGWPLLRSNPQAVEMSYRLTERPEPSLPQSDVEILSLICN